MSQLTERLYIAQEVPGRCYPDGDFFVAYDSGPVGDKFNLKYSGRGEETRVSSIKFPNEVTVRHSTLKAAREAYYAFLEYVKKVQSVSTGPSKNKSSPSYKIW